MDDLHSKLQYLLDRQAILDCVNRYCHGLDRHDAELIRSAYHPDALDEHGPFQGGPQDFATWANDFHADVTLSHTHNITTHTCEIDGDTAHAQSYCLYALRRKDGRTVMLGGGRYIDRLTRRNGEWKISLRKLYIDWRCNTDGTVFDTPNGYPAGMWGREDPSFARPLLPTARQGG